MSLWVCCSLAAQDQLEREFRDPPDAAKVWCYWWWLNGAASKEGITRDFEEMKKQGIGGALLFDAGEAGSEAPRGPKFMSPEWRELYKHAVREADRLGIVLGVNLCSGWNAGGAWVTPEHAAKKIVGAPAIVKGPGPVTVDLPQPAKVQGFYHDIAVLACPIPDGASPEPQLSASSSYREYLPPLAQDGLDDTRWISNGDKPGMGPTPEKPEHLQFDFAEPWPAAALYLKAYSDCGPKEIEIQCSDDGTSYRMVKRATIAPRQELTLPFDEVQSKHFRVVFLSSHPFQGQECWNVQVSEIGLLTRAQRETSGYRPRGVWDRSRAVDLTKFMDQQGRLTWDAPSGAWNVLRIGYTLHGNAIKCVGSGPSGLEIDTMSAAAMDAHFAETGAKLIADAGPLAGKSLQYFHIDSWELGQPTWTPAMRDEFQRRRGYDPLPYLPALVNKTVDDAAVTQRFLQDYRRTAADLVAAHYYGRLRELTLQGGLRGTHPESGGPFFEHWIDALQCEGINDVPMGEFWKRNSEPDGPVGWQGNPTIKQIASAAHIYGKPICQAEAFTSFADDWIDDPWSMKDIGDSALCEGLTRNVLCFWVHQSRLDAKPGFQWAHVGTHFDCNLTWWDMSHAWLTYLARCQHLLRQGRFVADFAYLQPEDVPSFLVPRDKQEPARPAGFDYDVLNAEVLLSRVSVQDGRLVLPDGMSYRYLVLPHRADRAMSLAVLRKVKELAEAGATVIGPPPERALGLADFPRCDDEVKTLAAQLWGETPEAEGSRACGQGRILWGRGLDAIVQADGLAADVEFRDPTPQAKLDFIHRRDGDRDIYFLCNLSREPAAAEVWFRTGGKQPELWDAVTGEIRDLPDFRQDQGRTAVPHAFRTTAVVLRRLPDGCANPKASPGAKNFAEPKAVAEIAGPWQVSFDPKWGGPEQAVFDSLTDWTKRPEDGIKYYSGKATYRQDFRLSPIRHPGPAIQNLPGPGHDSERRPRESQRPGPGRRLDRSVASGNHRRRPAGANDLEIEVANLWPNRLIGDAALPADQRLTVTNVRTYDTMASGTYGCQKCEARKRSGQPAALLPSGLLGPVRLLVE